MRIIDSHTHVANAEIDFAPLYELAKELNYEKLTVHSLQSAKKVTQNMVCGLCKALHPHMTYAYGGLDYVSGRDFLTQAKTLREIGFDGMKMLEGKPTTRRMLGRALDDPEYDDYFSWCEETRFPVMLHVADPGTFWDEKTAPDWAVANGWCYNETDVPYAQYYEEVNNMLAKHPKLNAVFAHFYFLSGDPVRCQQFLDDHPNARIDITAGIEMYEDFSKDPKYWRAFFIKNKERIVFGTDSNDAPFDPEGKTSINGYAAMEIEFIKQDNEIQVFDKKLHGLGLPEDAQALIFAKNYLNIAGETPRKLDIDALKREIAFMAPYIKEESDIATRDTVLAKLDALRA
jgi:hypothetical protein